MLDPANLNYEELGFHAGLEIHHQIKSTRKLFCHCPPKLIPSSTPPDYRFERYFRPVLGEMGDYDPGMLIEFEKGYRCIYHAFEACDCIYEQDEQPPFWPDMVTIKNAYQLAHWFDMSALVDEVIFARKQYLDGSITTGFQRTAIVGRDGYVEVDGNKIRISNLTVEEDAARKIKTENFGRTVYYNLDRLGVPLVEVITDHRDVNNPTQLLKLARMIGLTLRISDIGRRGIGAVRQDVNISITGGDRVELKGVQDLSMFEKWCQHEAVRQDMLIKIARELHQFGLEKDDLEHTYTDLSDKFPNLAHNYVVMGIRLPKFGNVINKEIQPDKDFGQDILEKTALITGVPMDNMFFSHEINDSSIRRNLTAHEHNYFFNHINPQIHEEILSELNIHSDDAYFIAVHTQKWVIHAMKKVIERSKMALDGVPQETRRALPNGNSEFLRVIHGKGRLYPDTDTPIIDMDMEEINSLKQYVKAKPWEIEKNFTAKYRMEFNQLENLIRHQYLEIFKWLVEEHNLEAKMVYYFLENTLKFLKRKGLPIKELSRTMILKILKGVQQKQFDESKIPEICRIMIKESLSSIQEALSHLNIEHFTKDDLQAQYQIALKQYQNFIGEKELKIENNHQNGYMINKITGFIMNSTNGGIPGQEVRQFVKNRLNQ